MGLILTILLGALIGFLATHLFGRREGFIVSAIIGIVGAFLGNLVAHLLGQGNQAALDFDLSNLLWSLAGSILLVVILNAVQHRPNTPRI